MSNYVYETSNSLMVAPQIVYLPNHGKTALKFRAKGPGRTRVVYSIIDPDPASACFIENGEQKYEIIREVQLSIYTFNWVCHIVEIDRKDDTKNKESFRIRTDIIELDESGQELENPSTTSIPPEPCHYVWEPDESVLPPIIKPTCPPSPRLMQRKRGRIMKTMIMLLFIVTLFFSACHKHNPSDYQKDIYNDEKELILELPFEINIATRDVPADGKSSLEVLVRFISDSAITEKKEVTLTTTDGTWKTTGKQEVKVKPTVNKEAAAHLVSSLTPGQVHIKASMDYLTAEETVQFEHAYPDKIKVEAGTFVLKAGLENSTTITAYLERSQGIPSVQTNVKFKAEDRDGVKIGKFRAKTTSNNQGIATAIYTAGNTEYNGPVKIYATVSLPDGEEKEGKTEITIVPPD